jgi:hypothetical protein
VYLSWGNFRYVVKHLFRNVEPLWYSKNKIKNTSTFPAKVTRLLAFQGHLEVFLVVFNWSKHNVVYYYFCCTSTCGTKQKSYGNPRIDPLHWRHMSSRCSLTISFRIQQPHTAQKLTILIQNYNKVYKICFVYKSYIMHRLLIYPPEASSPALWRHVQWVYNNMSNNMCCLQMLSAVFQLHLSVLITHANLDSSVLTVPQDISVFAQQEQIADRPAMETSVIQVSFNHSGYWN